MSDGACWYGRFFGHPVVLYALIPDWRIEFQEKKHTVCFLQYPVFGYTRFQFSARAPARYKINWLYISISIVNHPGAYWTATTS